jgi:hypothetical protein
MSNITSAFNAGQASISKRKGKRVTDVGGLVSGIGCLEKNDKLIFFYRNLAPDTRHSPSFAARMMRAAGKTFYLRGVPARVNLRPEQVFSKHPFK